MIEVRHLRCFVAVAEELHFHRAAERLQIGQPAVSVNVRTLEQELGVALVHRSTRQVRLTDAGTAFLDQARAAIAAFDHATRTGTSEGAEASGRLAVGGSSHVRHRLSNVLAAFRRTYPDADVLKREWGTTQLLSEVERGLIDVAIGVEPEHRAGLEYQAIAEEPLVLVVPADHPISRTGSVALAELADEVILLPSDRRAHGFNRKIIASCHQAGFTPSVAARATDHDERFRSVLDGAGVEPRCLDYVSGRIAPGTAFVPIVPQITVSLQAFWRGDTTNPLVEVFVRTALEC